MKEIQSSYILIYVDLLPIHPITTTLHGCGQRMTGARSENCSERDWEPCVEVSD